MDQTEEAARFPGFRVAAGFAPPAGSECREEVSQRDIRPVPGVRPGGGFSWR